MKYHLFLLLGCIFFFKSNAQNDCYQEEGNFPEHTVFIKMNQYPHYGRSRLGSSEIKFKQLILSGLDYDKITGYSYGPQFFTDTLNIKFIIDQQGKMSNLTVVSSKFPILENELKRIIISSACNWNPGEISGRKLTGWYKKNMILNFDGRGSSLSVKIEFIKD
jgi:hypothetical protein